MRKKEWILFLACLTAVFLSASGLFSRQCAFIRDNTLRLHILANSDSPQDQHLKLLVRDAVLEGTKEVFSRCESRQEVAAEAQKHLSQIAAIARKTLLENGSDLSVTAQLTEQYFDTRKYGDKMLPAGVYTALQIRLGEASGKNWWCVLYPPLCLQSACEMSDDALLVEGQLLSADAAGQYEIRFALVQWLQRLLERSGAAKTN